MAQQDAWVPLITSTLADLVTGVEGILEKASITIKDVGPSEFAATKIGMLWSAMSLYAAAYRKLNCKTRVHMEDLIGKHFRSMEIQDSFDHLEETEMEWDKMLTDLDDELNKSEKTNCIVVGGPGPQVPLVDVRTNKETNLEKYLDGRSLVCVLLRHFA